MTLLIIILVIAGLLIAAVGYLYLTTSANTTTSTGTGTVVGNPYAKALMIIRGGELRLLSVSTGAQKVFATGLPTISNNGVATVPMARSIIRDAAGNFYITNLTTGTQNIMKIPAVGGVNSVTVFKTLTSPAGPQCIVFNPIKSVFYIALSNSGKIVVMTMSGTLTDLATGLYANSMAVHPDGQTLYAAAFQGTGTSIFAFNTTTFAQTTFIAGITGPFIIHPNGQYMYAISEAALLKKITIPGAVATQVLIPGVTDMRAIAMDGTADEALYIFTNFTQSNNTSTTTTNSIVKIVPSTAGLVTVVSPNADLPNDTLSQSMLFVTGFT